MLPVLSHQPALGGDEDDETVKTFRERSSSRRRGRAKMVEDNITIASTISTATSLGTVPPSSPYFQKRRPGKKRAKRTQLPVVVRPRGHKGKMVEEPGSPLSLSSSRSIQAYSTAREYDMVTVRLADESLGALPCRRDWSLADFRASVVDALASVLPPTFSFSFPDVRTKWCRSFFVNESGIMIPISLLCEVLPSCGLNRHAYPFRTHTPPRTSQGVRVARAQEKTLLVSHFGA